MPWPTGFNSTKSCDITEC